MSGLGFGFKEVKGGFLDSDRILASIDRAELKALGKFGAFTRRTMKNSIKYHDGTAPAGKPPFAHRSKGHTKTNKKTGRAQPQSPLRELIYFAIDKERRSVAVGPVIFGRGGAGALEHGGTTTTARGGSVRISPHPFARPAGEKEAKKLPELLRDMVR